MSGSSLIIGEGIDIVEGELRELMVEEISKIEVSVAQGTAKSRSLIVDLRNEMSMVATLVNRLTERCEAAEVGYEEPMRKALVLKPYSEALLCVPLQGLNEGFNEQISVLERARVGIKSDIKV